MLRIWLSGLLRSSAWYGVVAIALSIGMAEGAIGQIVPDDTLGAERSRVRNSGSVDLIDRGARRGTNIFHSLRDFNVGEGRSTYFFNPSNDIQNILARVTGNNRSEILGTLGIYNATGVTSNPNLFLINPNGIVFGSNASLDVGGSFVGTTANAIGFGDRGWFSATNPEAPSPLLTVHPSAFLFNQIPTGSIVVNSNAPVSTGNIIRGLFVPVRQSLLLLGGNVSIDGGQLNAFGGRVEIGAVAGEGIVGLNADDSFNFLTGIPRADVSFTNGAQANVFLDKGGSISITAGNIDILGDSKLLAGIFSGSRSPSSQAGDITLNATGNIQIRQASRIGNDVDDNAIGDAGNLNITAGSLLVTGGSQLSTITRGQGNAGNVTIRATGHISFDNSDVFSNVEENARGQGGDVLISAGSLSFTNSSQLSASTYSNGDAGHIIIDASDRVSLDGTNTTAFSRIEPSGNGSGGDIRITTGSLFLSNGAQLNVDGFGRGSIGSIIINARNLISFDGTGNTGKPSAAFSRLQVNGIGQAGDIRIQAGSLSVTNNATLQSLTFGRGDAGNIIINARDRVSFNRGEAISAVNRNAIGNGGNVEVTTSSLSLTNGAILDSATGGQGSAGDVIINAHRAVLLSGTDRTGSSSGIFSSNLSTTTGQGGKIQVTTPTLTITNRAVVDARTATARQGGNVFLNTDSLSLLNGGQVITSTLSTGRAGNITLNADRIILSGRDSTFAQRKTRFYTTTLNLGRGESGLFTNTDRNSTGQAGDINIRTRQLNVRDNAEVAVNSRGTGQAGNLTVSANNIRLDRGTLTAETRSTSNQAGANIRIQDIDRLLYLQNGSQISARAFDNANGGNVTINANNGFVVARTGANQNNDIIARANAGNGGQVDITAQGILGLEQRSSTPANTTNDIDVSSDQGLQGTVTLNLPNTDPSRGLTELPTTPIDATNRIASTCPTNTQEADRLGSFIVSGRGGLPPSPTDLLSNDNVLTEWVTPGESGHVKAEVAPPSPSQAIVEAQGWVRDAQGKVRLVAASAPAAIAPTSCP